MSKAVLISIQPKWCELILNGKKTIEIRKTKPNLKPPFKCYIYQTKIHLPARIAFGGVSADPCGVVAEFVCDKFVDVDCDSVAPFDHDTKEYIPECCVSREELIAYCGMKRAIGWHISDLKVYDEPKKLYEFFRFCGENPICDKYEGLYYSSTECGTEEYCCSKVEGCMPLHRPPQSWCYVEELE